MKFILIALVSSFSLVSYGEAGVKNCFSGHLLEAIQVNKARMRFYSDVSNGGTSKIFKRLILSEYLSLTVARFYDLRARPYQKAGVPLFCREFLPMNSQPDFDPERRKIPTKKFEEFDWRKIKTALHQSVMKNDIEGIKRISLDAVLTLKDSPSYHCMVRHIFESIYRFAHFIPLNEIDAQKHGLRSPKKLSLQVIRLQLFALESSAHLDLLSAPFHEEGIPVLCAELPDLVSDLL